MKAIFLCAFLFASLGAAVETSDDNGDISISKFEVSMTPAQGQYAPWRKASEQSRCYAGEIVSITNRSFRYVTFSDVGNPKHPRPDYSGSLKIFPDHVYLGHPAVPYPYRVAGVADGIPVLVTWEGYEQWKKAKKIFEINILWLSKEDTKEANNRTQRTPR